MRPGEACCCRLLSAANRFENESLRWQDHASLQKSPTLLNVTTLQDLIGGPLYVTAGT